MKKIILPFVLLISTLIANSQVEYSKDKFSETKKMHKKIVEVTPDFFLKHNVGHLQIIECVAEVTINEKALTINFPVSGEFEDFYKKKHPKYSKKIGETYFETALDVVYNRFNKMLSDNGLFPTEKEKVINNPTYIKLNLQKTGYEMYKGGNVSKETNLEVCSSGMMPLPKNLDFNANKDFNEELARIAKENEADAALKIHIGITINEDGSILLTKYDVLMDTWMAGYRKGDRTNYKWKVLDTELFKLKNEVKGSSGHADLDSLDTELINIFDSITEMYSYAISSHL